MITSVVVDDLNILRARIGPSEKDPVLVIDPDTVLPLSVATKRLESIPRWDSQVIENRCGVQGVVLPGRLAPHCGRQTLSGCLCLTPVEQMLCS